MTRWIIPGLLGLSLAGFALWSASSGQEAKPPVSPPAKPLAAPPAKPAGRDLDKFSALHRQLFLSAQRGTDWLKRAHRADGRFVYGVLPALSLPMEGDDYLGQVEAALSLARAAGFFGDPLAETSAQRALLRLLIDTAVDPQAPTVRAPSLPAFLVNRLAAAGMLVAAIHELPNPGKDLLEAADQLCHFIARQQQADGSLKWYETEEAKGNAEGVNLFPGPALYGIIRSQQHRPAPWKIELVRKACKYYLPWWREHKNLTMVTWHSGAYAEAYLITKERPFADAVLEMNDWLCTLQYQQMDPRRPHWLGGFTTANDAKTTGPSTLASALAAQSLVQACRVARQAGEAPRFKNFHASLEQTLKFLTTLQYSEGNTRHFADWYKGEVLLGGFFASHQDGNLRLEYTQRAVAALVHYLHHVAELP